MKRRTTTKGQLNLGDAPGLVVTLVVLALVIAVSSVVLIDFRTTTDPTGTCSDGNASTSCPSFAYNATTDGLTAIDNVSNQLGTVGTIIIAAILLGLIVTAFVFFQRRG